MQNWIYIFMQYYFYFKFLSRIYHSSICLLPHKKPTTLFFMCLSFTTFAGIIVEGCVRTAGLQ